MAMFKNLFAFGIMLLSVSSHAANIWTGGVSAGEEAHKISVIDSSGTENTTLITLEGFAHERCAALSNRVILTSTSVAVANNLTSLALSAFHSGTKVSAFINENCEAERIILLL